MPLDPENKKRLSDVLDVAFSAQKEIEALWDIRRKMSEFEQSVPSPVPPGTLDLNYFNQRVKDSEKKVAEHVKAAEEMSEPIIQNMPLHMQDIARKTVEDVCYGDLNTYQDAHEAFEERLSEKEKSMIDPEIPPDATPEQQHDLELAHSVEREMHGRWGAMEAGMPDMNMDMDAPQIERDDDD